VKPLAAPPEARDLLALAQPADPTVATRLEGYAGWLAGPGVERGLLGPREVDRIWNRHLVNCGLLAPLLPREGSVCDVGSGAGLPGIVVAVLRPSLDLVLLEPLLRRATFLQEVVDDLDLANVTVVRDRAEDYAHRQPGHDVVVARAVAPLPRLVTWCLPLLSPGGVLLALKGQNAARELIEAQGALDRAGVVDRAVLTLGEDGNVTHAVRVVRPLDPLNDPAPEVR
jgi:16S rRNA (guanine527-N7)-methyltransferase